MSDENYWVEIHQEGKLLGAGFLLTRCYALTAFHCVSNVKGEAVDIFFPSGETLPGRLHRLSPEADLALIDIPKAGDIATAPHVDKPSTGDPWSDPYRPGKSHAYLSGTVTASTVEYQCASGDTIEAMQLECSQPLGSYHGYSGSPVERGAPSQVSTVLGILLEQYPDSQIPQRASTVLFAATIAEIFRRFDCFDVSRLTELVASIGDGSELADMSNLKSSGDLNSIQKPFEHRISRANAVLEALHAWQERGLLDELNVSQISLEVARRLADDALEKDV
jgi:hypothetical protein